MKILTTIVATLLLLSSCSKNRTYRQKGQIIEIANWRYDKSIVPVAGIRVCVMDHKSQDNFLGGSIGPTKSYNCGVTDADGKFDVSLTVPRKEYRQNSFLTYIPQQNAALIDRDYSDGRSNNAMSKKNKCFTLGVYKIIPVVITLNNVNYLNDRDSIKLEGAGSNLEPIFTGKQNNRQIRGVFRGDKSWQNPNVLGGGFAYTLFKNGLEFSHINFNNKIILQNDTGYYVINY
jgi:hypothetical protein